MKEILSKAQPLLDVRIESEIDSALKGGSEEQTQAIKNIAGWLSRFKDPIGREVRIQKATQRLRISRALLDKAMGQGPTPKMEIRNTRAKPEILKITPIDRILLASLVQGGDRFSALLAEASLKLPPQTGLFDLFTYEPARIWVRKLLEPSRSIEELIKNFRESPELSLSGEIDAQVRSTIMEAVMAADANGSVKAGEDEIKMAIDRAVARSWARFSHQLRQALEDAEAKKDAQLRDRLLQEYLDVPLKIKEFNSFYDEA
jgi:hypothetical protein